MQQTPPVCGRCAGGTPAAHASARGVRPCVRPHSWPHTLLPRVCGLCAGRTEPAHSPEIALKIMVHARKEGNNLRDERHAHPWQEDTLRITNAEGMANK